MKPVILKTLTDVLVAMLQGHSVKITNVSVFGVPEKEFDIEPPNSSNTIVISKSGTPVSSHNVNDFDELIEFTFPEEDSDPPIMYYVPKWDANLSFEKPVLVLATNDQETFFVGFAFGKDEEGKYKVVQSTNAQGQIPSLRERTLKFSQANPIEVQNVEYPQSN